LLTIILYGLGFIALFILFIVLINFLNLTSALSLTRLNEVSVRRVLGANRRELIGQFILEAALVAGVGVGLGALLLQASLPHYISFFGIETMFAPRLSWNTLPFLLAIVALLGILGGLVPGLYLASQRFMGSWQEKTRSLRIPFQSSLVVVQFTLATILMACTGIMLVQNRFVKTQSTGFQVAHRLLIPLNRAYRNPVTAEVQISGLLMQLRHHPDVVQFSTNSSVPGTNLTSSNLFSLPVKSEYWMC
jgi:putative ABC transport system permease protein